MRTSGEGETAALGARLAAALEPGDVLLLSGPVGAGKSVLARAVIQAAQRLAGDSVEDVPSPSFTLVQTYRAGGLEIWHCDLYRLGDPGELDELGLADAGSNAVLLVEWPDIARDGFGARRLEIAIMPVADDPDGRQVTLSAQGGGWAHVEAALRMPARA